MQLYLLRWLFDMRRKAVSPQLVYLGNFVFMVSNELDLTVLVSRVSIFRATHKSVISSRFNAN